MKKAGQLTSLFAAGAAMSLLGGAANAQSAPYGPPLAEPETTYSYDFDSDRMFQLRNEFDNRDNDKQTQEDREELYRMMADEGYIEYFPDMDTFDRQWINERTLDRFMRENNRRVGLNDRFADIDQLDFHRDIPSLNDVEDFETRFLDRDDMPSIFGAVCVPYDERLSTVCMKPMNDGRASLDFFYDNREMNYPSFGDLSLAQGTAPSLAGNDMIERNVKTYGIRYSIRFK